MLNKRIILMKKLISTLLVCFSINACATAPENDKKDIEFGEWTSSAKEISNGVIVKTAKTSNKNGHLLGIICVGDGECQPYLQLNLTCEDGKEYPMLMATDEGIRHLYALCEDFTNTMLFTLHNDAINLIKEAKSFGIAYGKDNSRFQASYFNMDGSKESILETTKDYRNNPHGAEEL